MWSLAWVAHFHTFKPFVELQTGTMERLARFPIGKITLQSMGRRHALWAGLNGAVSISLYFLVKIVAKFVYGKLGADVAVFSALEFTAYLSIVTLLQALTYVAYVSYGANFGGTNITLRPLKTLPITIIIPLVVGALCGKMLLDLVHWRPVTPISLLLVSSRSHLVPALAGAVALLLFCRFPPSPRPLQASPQPIMESFVRHVITSAKQAGLRGAKIASILSVAFCVLRYVELLVLTMTCDNAQTSPVCSSFLNKADTHSYLPASSIWRDAGSGLFVAAVLLFLLGLFQKSLAFMSTYPLDFQKLRLQLRQAEGNTRTRSSGNSNNSIVPNEQLLLQALLIGQESAPGTGSAGTPSATSEAVGFGSSNYSEQTALSEVQAQEARQALLVDSVVCVGMQPPVVPYLGEGADLIAPPSAHRKFPTNVLNNPNSPNNNSINSNAYQASTPPRVVLRVEKFDLLARALAFQDLHRLVSDTSEVALERRAVLFAKHWAQLLTATCGMIDATALQVHLLDDFLTKVDPIEELPQDELDSLLGTQTQISSDSSAAQAGVLSSPPPRPSTSFENMQKLRATLATAAQSSLHPSHRASRDVQVDRAAEDRRAASSAIERDPGGLRPRAMYSRNRDRHHQDERQGRPAKDAQFAQEVQKASKILTGMQEWLYLGFYSALHVPVPGYGVQYAADLPQRAFPPMTTASAVHAIQSIAGLLLLALTEDSTGYTQRSVCPVVRSLLTLESALSAYCGTLQASHFVRISSMGRTQQIRYRARSESAIPDSVRVLQQAVQEALGRVVRAYRDVLLIVVTQYDSQASAVLFSRTQVTALEAKLVAIA